MSAQLMPQDYEPPVRVSTNGNVAGELAEAVALARQHAGSWVQVGEPRFLSKPPTSWVSEVDRGEKTVFTRGEIWQANYDPTGQVDDDNRREYMKLIRLAEPKAA